MKLKFMDGDYSVCRLKSAEGVDLNAGVLFFARTPDEISLVCETGRAPANAEKTSHGWGMFRVEGELDFGLVGILAGITQALASASISVFAVSTYDTDYILVKRDKYEAARETLQKAGYDIS